MKPNLRWVALLVVLLLTACRSGLDLQPQHEGLPDEEQAKAALINFFEYLHAGQYAYAADLYAGPYDVMRSQNPTIDPDDHAALLQAACERNGAYCLQLLHADRVHLATQAEGQFLFAVQFQEQDGSVFTLGGCCGDPAQSGSEQRVFLFTVEKQAEYLYMVLEPPLYGP